MITKIALNLNSGEFNICSGKGKSLKNIAIEIGEIYNKKDLIVFEAEDIGTFPKKIIGKPN